MIVSYLLLGICWISPASKKALKRSAWCPAWGCLIRPEGFVLPLSLAVVLFLTPDGRKVLRTAALPFAGWMLFFFFIGCVSARRPRRNTAAMSAPF